MQIDSTPRFISPIIYLPVVDTVYNPKADLPLGKIYWKVSVTVNGTLYSSTIDSFVIVPIVKAENPGFLTIDQRSFVHVAPADRGITAEFFLQKPDNIALEVFSVNGMRIYSSGMLTSQPGSRTLAWNGVDRRVSGGSYCAVRKMGSKRSVTKTMIAK